jgi:hypothetical protein
MCFFEPKEVEEMELGTGGLLDLELIGTELVGCDEPEDPSPVLLKQSK